MIKRISLLSVMLAGSALAQQNMDISEKDVTSGAAQSRLSALARDAAASGKRVVVTAPQHLHAQIAAGLAAGGKADIVLKDGFYENVLVRVVDAPAEAPAAKPEVPKPAPRTVAPPPVRTAAPAPTRPQAIPAPAPAAPSPVAPAPRVESPQPATTPAEEPLDLAVPPAQPAVSAPAAARTTPPPAAEPAPAEEAEPAATGDAPTSGVFVGAEPGDLSPARASLEKLYNDGKRISETIAPNGLMNGDVIYTGNGAAVVVRRARPSLLRFWLDGSLNLDQSAIDAEGKNKYRVIGASVR